MKYSMGKSLHFTQLLLHPLPIPGNRGTGKGKGKEKAVKGKEKAVKGKVTRATRAWQEATMHKYASLVSKKLKAKERQKKCELSMVTRARSEHNKTIEASLPQDKNQKSKKSTNVERHSSIDLTESDVGEKTGDSADVEKTATVKKQVPATSSDDRKTSVNSAELEIKKSNVASSADTKRQTSAEAVYSEPVLAGVQVQFRANCNPVHVEVGRWVPVLSHQVCHLQFASGPKK